MMMRGFSVVRLTVLSKGVSSRKQRMETDRKRKAAMVRMIQTEASESFLSLRYSTNEYAAPARMQKIRNQDGYSNTTFIFYRKEKRENGAEQRILRSTEFSSN